MTTGSLQTHLSARIGTIRDDYTRLLRERVPFYQAVPEELLARATQSFLNVFLEALPTWNLEPPVALILDNVRLRAKQGLPLEGAIALATHFRRAILLSAEPLLAEEVKGVPALLLFVEDMCESLVETVTKFYAETLEVAQRARSESEARYQQLYKRTPAILQSLDAEGRLVQVSDRWLEVMGYAREEVIGQPALDFLSETSRRHATEVVLPALLRDGVCMDIHYQLVKKSGELVDMLISGVLERDASGAPALSIAAMVDITERERVARALKAQEATLLELSTPLIPVSDGVVVMPLIGNIDRTRADQMRRVLLDGIAAEGARVAILDVTGVPAVDAGVAEALLSAAKAARLLGAEVVFTGIRPMAARALVDIGSDFGQVVTRATLKDGIRYALAWERRYAPVVAAQRARSRGKEQP